MEEKDCRELVKLLEKELGIPCAYLNAEELKEHLRWLFKVKHEKWRRDYHKEG